jgi:hypothetical protein
MNKLSQPFKFLLFCSLLGLTTATSQDRMTASDELDRSANAESLSDLTHAIDRASRYLELACDSDGRFAYQIDTVSGNQSNSYNIIRHAGAIYALAMQNRSQPDPKVVRTMLRATEFLSHNYIASGLRVDQLAVWSSPVNRRSVDGVSVAELGAAGLALVALAEVNEANPGTTSLVQLQALGRFILFLQKNDGSFVSKYIAGSGPALNRNSLYYPGEAALGLVSLYKADRSPEWLIAAAKALSYLARSRKALITVPADHWALIAMAELLPYSDQIASIVSRDELVRHAIQVCNSILREQVASSAPVGLDGAFDPMGRTTPAATRLEGLLAALEFLPRGELSNKIEAASKRGIAFLLRAQITSGRYAGGMPGAVTVGAPHSSEVRIDYVQHALCAWLRYQRAFRASRNWTKRPTQIFR